MFETIVNTAAAFCVVGVLGAPIAIAKANPSKYHAFCKMYYIVGHIFIGALLIAWLAYYQGYHYALMDSNTGGSVKPLGGLELLQVSMIWPLFWAYIVALIVYGAYVVDPLLQDKGGADKRDPN
jgi:hypothetical protein